MKKNMKRTAAIAGVILLLILFILPMIFALGNGEDSQAWFRASVGAVILIPCFAYLMMLVYRVLDRRTASRPSGEIKNVVFDIGQVLMRFDWEGYLKSYGFPEEKYEKIADAVFRGPVWDQRDRGCLTEPEYVNQMVSLAPEYEKDIREVMRRSGETISLMDYAVTWVKYLKERGYHLYILSNYSEYMRQQTIDRMEFLPYMDGTVFSCDVKLLKPEREIYETLMEQCGIDGKETVFLDDRAENCEGARAAGLHAIQFFSMKQAAKELEKLGVK
ncbi:MAG: HAD family phosphatase [Blautia sp.]|nr:HAD family phosphatase [Blautia sp.]MDY5031239.1 HAD family phosphatase [Blautia sp.]